jgi:hypothetical protein
VQKNMLISKSIAISMFLSMVIPANVTPLSAQAMDTDSSPFVAVRSTPPTITSCGSRRAAGCFRTLIEIIATGDTPAFISFQHVGALGGEMAQSQGYLASGSTCEARAVSGLAVDYEPNWPLVTQTKPIRGVVQFYCDGPVRKGDTAYVDLSLWVQAKGHQRSFERFPFPPRPIQ